MSRERPSTSSTSAAPAPSTPRHKQVTVALATILDAAGVSWGILGKEEKCCGDSLRRLGNEYVFDKMAKENVKLFPGKRDDQGHHPVPPLLHHLKNDYRQYGLELEVIHHSRVHRRSAAAREAETEPAGAEDWARSSSTTPATWARHNDVYEAPRAVSSRRPPAGTRWKWSATGKIPSAAAPAAAGCGWKSIRASAST